MILTLISSRQVDTPSPSRRSPKCFRNDARTNAKPLQQLLLFECARAKTCSVTAAGQDICYKPAATPSPRPSGRRIRLPWNYSGGVYARLHEVNDRTNAFYTLIEALVTSLRFALV